jgi:hypothetical protein
VTPFRETSTGAQTYSVSIRVISIGVTPPPCRLGVPLIVTLVFRHGVRGCLGSRCEGFEFVRRMPLKEMRLGAKNGMPGMIVSYAV